MPTINPILSPILQVNTKSLLNDCLTNTYSCMCLSPLYSIYLVRIFLLTLYSTLLVIITHTTSSNILYRLFTHIRRITIAHTKELLNTLGGQLRYSNQLSWPNGGKKNRVYRFSMGWYISTWFII